MTSGESRAVENDINPLFRESDRAAMSRFASARR
jgi:hypothetical protein